MSRKGIKSHPDKVTAISNWSTPRTVKDVRSVLGLVGFYERFVKNFADTIAPLTSLLKKTATWSWQELHELSFAKLKQGRADSTLLAHPDMSLPFTLHIDASADALGATLSQPYRCGHFRLLTCTSRKLNPAECNYPTHDRKMLALVHALKKRKHYLRGSNVLAYTDNVALRYWKPAKNVSPRRWLAYIGMFDMDIAHNYGVTNTAADAIS